MTLSACSLLEIDRRTTRIERRVEKLLSILCNIFVFFLRSILIEQMRILANFMDANVSIGIKGLKNGRRIGESKKYVGKYLRYFEFF